MSRAKPRTWRRLLAYVLVPAVLLSAAVAGLMVWRSAHNSSSLETYELYTAPDSQAAQHLHDADVVNNPVATAALQRLAAAPTAVWFNGGTPAEIEVRARMLASDAARQNKVLQAVIYSRPNRDCQGIAPEGPTSDDYRNQILAFIRGVAVPEPQKGSNPPIVIYYEPDGVAHTAGKDACLKGTAATHSRALMAETIKKLKTRAHLRVYLDAGNPSWFVDPAPMVQALKLSGAKWADGLVVNVSNTQTRAKSLAYGRYLSDHLDGQTLAIDNSRNGNGPYTGSKNEAVDPSWCNPPGVKAGVPPTTRTKEDRLDIDAWIKPLGESDDTCRPGEPPAGHWMTDYAVAALTGS